MGREGSEAGQTKKEGRLEVKGRGISPHKATRSKRKGARRGGQPRSNAPRGHRVWKGPRPLQPREPGWYSPRQEPFQPSALGPDRCPSS